MTTEPTNCEVAPAIARRLDQIPDRHRGQYLQAIEGRSRKTAVRCFCLECMGWQSAEVPHCTDDGCPLYAYRLQG